MRTTILLVLFFTIGFCVKADSVLYGLYYRGELVGEYTTRSQAEAAIKKKKNEIRLKYKNAIAKYSYLGKAALDAELENYEKNISIRSIRRNTSNQEKDNIKNSDSKSSNLQSSATSPGTRQEYGSSKHQRKFDEGYNKAISNTGDLYSNLNARAQYAAGQGSYHMNAEMDAMSATKYRGNTPLLTSSTDNSLNISQYIDLLRPETDTTAAGKYFISLDLRPNGTGMIRSESFDMEELPWIAPYPIGWEPRVAEVSNPLVNWWNNNVVSAVNIDYYDYLDSEGKDGNPIRKGISWVSTNLRNAKEKINEYSSIVFDITKEASTDYCAQKVKNAIPMPSNYYAKMANNAKTIRSFEGKTFSILSPEGARMMVDAVSTGDMSKVDNYRRNVAYDAYDMVNSVIINPGEKPLRLPRSGKELRNVTVEFLVVDPAKEAGINTDIYKAGLWVENYYEKKIRNK